MKLTQRAAIAAALTLAFMAADSFGAGYALREHSSLGMGKAYAGAAAGLGDRSAAWYNPAALQLAPAGLTLGASIISVEAEFQNGGSANGLTMQPIQGNDGGDGGTTAVVPHAYYVRPLNDATTLGLSINVPFGLTTEWEDGWVGRYHALKSELKTINLSPSLGYAVNEKLSVGGGLNVVIAEGELSNAINLDIATMQPGAGLPDGTGALKGDDVGFGVNAGLLYLIDDKSRIGLHYRSHVDLKIEGDGEFEVAAPLAPLFAAQGIFTDTDASTEVELPETISVGYVNRISDKIAIAASVDWTKWSRFEELRVKFDNNQPDSVTEENWDDSYSVAGGFDYFLNDETTLRAGMMYDASPITNNDDRTPRIPDVDRVWAAAGVSHAFSQDIRVDASYAHLFGDEGSLNHVNATGDVVVGDVDATINLVSVQVNWAF